MGLIFSIDRCINTFPEDLLAEKVIYIELDKENYEVLQSEIISYTNLPGLKFEEEKIDSFGKCSIFGYNGYKVVIALSKDNKKKDTFYVAFKTKIL